MTGISEILVLILLILCILIVPRMITPKPSGKRKKNKVIYRGLQHENENCHCIIRSRPHHPVPCGQNPGRVRFRCLSRQEFCPWPWDGHLSGYFLHERINGLDHTSATRCPSGKFFSYNLNLPTISLRLSASLDNSRALSFMLLALVMISFAASLTWWTSAVTSAATVEVWLTFSLTS